MTEVTTTPFTTGTSRQGRRTVTSASSRLRRSRREDTDLYGTDTSRQTTKDIDLHDVPDDELREKRKQKLDRPKVMQKMYEKACSRYRVVPVRQYWEVPDNHLVLLPNYNLGSLGVQALSVPLMLHESILRLDLSGNDMGVNGVQALVEAFKGNTSVTELNLANNKLQTAGALALKEFLREHPVLQTLSLAGNGFKDEDSIIFGQVMKENQRLKHVDFSHNEFAETAGLQFRYVLADTENLETFDISWNHLRRKGAMDLLAGVKKNYGLRVLDISFNGFAAEGSAVLANVLKKNRTLQEVDIRHNRLNDKDVINIASKMDANDSLRVLKLGDNHFTLNGAMALLTVLLNPDNVVALELLDLGNVCVNEDFDFIANQLKTSRQNLTIKYGRVVDLKKKVLKRQIPESVGVKNASQMENTVGRANTLPNMSNAAKPDVDDLEFVSALDSTESAVGANLSSTKKDNKNDYINSDIQTESNDEQLNVKQEGKDKIDENHFDGLQRTDKALIEDSRGELDSVSKNDENSANEVNGIYEGSLKEKTKDRKESNSSLDPRNLFVLQRQTFIEKKLDS